MIKKIKKPKDKAYHLVMEFNDKVFKCDTDDLYESILSFKPEVLKTRVIITITNKEGKSCERLLFGFMGKQLFRNALFLKVFIMHLIFK